jgi:DNA invertase Pin-like site-specific DNA recombinase
VTTSVTKVAVYARVSTFDQNCENQLADLRRYCEERGWRIFKEFIDHGVSGSKESRPALDELVGDARRHRFGVVVAWKLDRLGRNLRHLVMLLAEWEDLGVRFVSLDEGIDLATPAGRLQLHILAALAEFERGRIQERVKAGLDRAKSQGRRLGRPPLSLAPGQLEAVAGLSVKAAAAALGVSTGSVKRLRRGSKTLIAATSN